MATTYKEQKVEPWFNFLTTSSRQCWSWCAFSATPVCADSILSQSMLSDLAWTTSLAKVAQTASPNRPSLKSLSAW